MNVSAQIEEWEGERKMTSGTPAGRVPGISVFRSNPGAVLAKHSHLAVFAVRQYTLPNREAVVGLTVEETQGRYLNDYNSS